MLSSIKAVFQRGLGISTSRLLSAALRPPLFKTLGIVSARLPPYHTRFTLSLSATLFITSSKLQHL